MVALQIRIDGGRQLRAGLSGLDDGLSDLKGVHKDVASIAATGAAARAPVVSGRLKATIRAAGTKTAGIIRVGSKARAPHAGPINYGWQKRNIAPSYFLNDGAQATEPRWVPVYQNHLTRLIERIEGA